MDLSFTAEELAFREEVRAFLRANLSDRLREGTRRSPGVWVEPDIGREWHQKLYEKGWIAYNWPAEYGGPGWSAVQRYIFEKESALADAPPLPNLSLKLVGPVIYTFGTPEQKSYYLPRILSGEDYWCQGFSEPGAGSDLANLSTKAVREGDHYVVNGTKMWTTHAHYANRIFCLVRTDPTVKPQAGISFLLIDMDQPGVEITPILTLAGDHEVNQVFFDNAKAPLGNLVGDEGQGWTIAKFLLENERGGSCFAPKLLADLSLLEEEAGVEPDGRGGRLADDPSWRRRVGQLRLSVEALEVIELRILAEISAGRAPGPQTSLVKLLASKARQEIDLLAVDLYGDAGLQLDLRRPLYGDGAPPPVHSPEAQVATARYLNSRAWTIFGGTDEIQRNIIAKTVLGL